MHAVANTLAQGGGDDGHGGARGAWRGIRSGGAQIQAPTAIFFSHYRRGRDD